MLLMFHYQGHENILLLMRKNKNAFPYRSITYRTEQMDSFIGKIP